MSIHTQMVDIYSDNVNKVKNRQELVDLIVKEICKRNKYISKDEVFSMKERFQKEYKDLNFVLNEIGIDDKMTKRFDRLDTFSDCIKEFEDGKHIKSLPWSTYDEKKLNNDLKELLNFIGIDSSEIIYLMAMNESIYSQAFIYIKENLHKFMKDGLMISNPNPNEYYMLQINVYSQLTFIHRWMKDNDKEHLKKSKMISLDDFKTKFDGIYNKRTMNYVEQISKQHQIKLPEPVDSKPTHIKGA